MLLQSRVIVKLKSACCELVTCIVKAVPQSFMLNAASLSMKVKTLLATDVGGLILTESQANDCTCVGN